MKLLRYPFVNAGVPETRKPEPKKAYDPYSKENLPLFQRAFDPSLNAVSSEFALDTSSWD